MAPRNSGGKKLTLRGIMPEDGVTYSNAHRVTTSVIGDEKIIMGIRQAGTSMTRTRIRNILEDMFKNATPLFKAGHEENDSVKEMLCKLRLSLDWTVDIDQDLFAELFISMIHASRN
ncbi:hypothetical protein F5Y18DRAFT_423333 [Xylariaceae sp. FL1019]|nr:hypothetical protein F5Y18DRAFT_423333 [Xylariaceae sp. FL1019]